MRAPDSSVKSAGRSYCASLVSDETNRRGLLGIRPGLERIGQVLEEMGSPHLAMGKVVTIAGTNGKGSTAAFLESILRSSGAATALFTSPHLVSINERLRFSGVPVAGSRFDEAGVRVLKAEVRCGIALTGFEFCTAAAFACIADESPDYSVIEVGMGGRLDATNVVQPAATAITALGLDHCPYLGDNLPAIAREKLGITRPGIPCVCGRQDEAAGKTIETYCRRHGTPLALYGRDFETSGTDENWTFLRPDFELHGITLGLAGFFQVENASVATMLAIELLGSGREAEAIRSGLAATRWPGRFDLRMVQGVPVLFDGGHNLPAVKALVEAFSRRWQHKPAVLYAAREDKDAHAIMEVLKPLASGFVFTRPGDSRGGWEPSALVQLAAPVTAVAIEEPLEALRKLVHAEDDKRVRLCCGSFYLVGYLARHGRACHGLE